MNAFLERCREYINSTSPENLVRATVLIGLVVVAFIGVMINPDIAPFAVGALLLYVIVGDRLLSISEDDEDDEEDEDEARPIGRQEITIEIEEELLFALYAAAHAEDMSLNDYVNRVIREALKDITKGE